MSSLEFIRIVFGASSRSFSFHHIFLWACVRVRRSNKYSRVYHGREQVSQRCAYCVNTHKTVRNYRSSNSAHLPVA